MRLFKLFIVLMVLVVCSGTSFATDESDDNTYDIRASLIGEKVYITWSSLADARLYDVYIEETYGTYSQKFTVTDSALSLSLTSNGVYKIKIEGFDSSSVVEYDLGYLYFAYNEGEQSSIDADALAKSISEKVNKNIDKKVYIFRTLWNETWWSGLSISNTSNEQKTAKLVIVDPVKLTTTETQVTLPAYGIVKDNLEYFLKLANINTEEMSGDGNYLVTIECDKTMDAEAYIFQIVDSEFKHLVKDASVDHYTFLLESEQTVN